MDNWLISFWNAVREYLTDVPSLAQLGRLVMRLMLAAILGGLLGFERQHKGKAAGVRTHMLVALGSALFVLVSQQYEMSNADLSRVVQGILTGIGFIGAGAILKMTEQGQVRGLTTAASIWLTAAVGTAAGLGKGFSAIIGTVLALVILAVLPMIESRFEVGEQKDPH
jgi:putative Mg2+ transporter-C (MgtC) family protein